MLWARASKVAGSKKLSMAPNFTPCPFSPSCTLFTVSHPEQVSSICEARVSKRCHPPQLKSESEHDGYIRVEYVVAGWDQSLSESLSKSLSKSLSESLSEVMWQCQSDSRTLKGCLVEKLAAAPKFSPSRKPILARCKLWVKRPSYSSKAPEQT